MYFERFDPLKGEELRILDPEGNVKEELRPDLSDARVRELYERLCVLRLADLMAMKLQREGSLGTYAPVYGQEAAQASAVFLETVDWLVPSYRESGALFLRGVPLASIYRYWKGDERGMILPEGSRILPIEIVVGAQPLHAVGLSWAMKLKGEPGVAAAYFGDGASSQGDVHEAMNFAGVFKTPTVFVCQNNQFAISLPRSQQTAAATIAQRAASYGFAGLLVDGNDLLAVAGAMKEALAEARAGRGPRLIELLTYRLGPHTTSDDPTKYRTADELERHKAFDPLPRLRKYLQRQGLWNEEKESALQAQARAEVEQAVRQAEAPLAPVTDIFDFTYKQAPPYLKRQREELAAFLQSQGRGGSRHGEA
ncbi:MAG TPA: pyruvate dehydrogenase (acetyl-transferring) E1 component subunit alpha [Elusimicrobia bacterium]|nr:pyruvate dehydrogenase (acetyl-transferring) E1 component subunit alpha [Elusimicrobiota bacterium]HBT61592.1 pyruvate dehydrogenase (acetyl-transferring) E1 component subunit alpha [Elusimicrobiota bacterium]